jgi:hypothetical protein
VSRRRYYNEIDKSCAAASDKKRSDIDQIRTETDVTDYLAHYKDGVNKILARAGEPYVINLEFEEANTDTDVKLGKLDPIAADFVRALKSKIAFANRKMLKSFRLKLSIEEVAA